MAGPNTSQYALGRNSIFKLRNLNINEGSGGTPTPGPLIVVCTSSGSIDLSANTISIINNCNYGWEIKLPGTKTGTVSLTGHVVSGIAGVNGIDVVKLHGAYIEFICGALDSNLEAGLVFEAYGVVTSSRVNIDINDAVTVELSIEISGQPSTNSFIVMADNTN